MFRVLVICCVIYVGLLVACNKGVNAGESVLKSEYTAYTIAAGGQFSDINFYQPIQYSEIKFKVRFDSSCIYTTITPVNQYDINKLYGFSDNNAHHQDFSARFGWRWSDDSLRLFAYTYNNGIRDSKELGTIAIGLEQSCSIRVLNDSYLFTLNDKSKMMPRRSSTAQAQGYKLYPYFGGDELAPHKITIHIKDL